MKILLAALLSAVLASNFAVASGPSGSTESTSNEVTCGAGTDVAGTSVYAGPNGVEVCNDGGNSAIPQGRVIASADQGGYVAADGDADNETQLTGYVRVDAGGLHCGGPANEDSTKADQSGNATCEEVPL